MANEVANTKVRTKVFGRGSHECLLCGRKQGLVRRYNIFFCRQCFREWAPKLGFKKLN